MSDYSFVNRKGDDQTAIRIESGRFENVIYNYGKVTIPQKENEDGTMPFRFEYNILDNAEIPRSEFDEEFFTLIGDILVDIIENEDYVSSKFDYGWTT
jgi:hypothetical protein